MLGSAEVSHLIEGLHKILEEAKAIKVKAEKFKQLSDLRDKLNES